MFDWNGIICYANKQWDALPIHYRYNSMILSQCYYKLLKIVFKVPNKLNIPPSHSVLLNKAAAAASVFKRIKIDNYFRSSVGKFVLRRKQPSRYVLFPGKSRFLFWNGSHAISLKWYFANYPVSIPSAKNCQ